MKVGIAGGADNYERTLVARAPREGRRVPNDAGARLGRPRSLDAGVVARIVADHERGCSQTAIADALNAEGVPTARGGARWYQGTVRAVLRSVALDGPYPDPARGGTANGTSGPAVEPGPGSGRLPVYGDRFVGRTRELAELSALLATERMVTLTGPAGVGKTRLALELARRVSDGSPEGAWFVELAPLSEAAGVPRAVASRLAVWDRSDQSLSAMVVAHLRHRRVLLVLDNCEHLVNGCTELAAAILDGCPEVSIVATSQSPLGMPQERLWSVPALSVPPSDEGVERLAASEAVRLFAERASSAHRGFALSPEVVGHVGEICRRLDGIPLAIELAAARVSVLAPAEIAARLDDRFSLLTGRADAPLPRHQTLWRALDWSYELLTAPEQALLTRMSVFVGGCTLEAVEAVCGDRPPCDEGILDPLSSLVAKSLVVADTTGAWARYRLLETVRAYGAEQLALAGETDECRDLHSRWFAALAERARPRLVGAEQQTWLDALEADHDNIRAAMGWAIAGGRSEPALRLAGSLTLFWRMRGHFREGGRWLEAALALAGEQPPAVRARALWGAGFFAHMLGEDDAAWPRLEESLTLARATDDLEGQARALLLLANTRVFTDPAAAMPQIEESIACARRAEDAWCLAHALALAGLGRERLGDRDTRGVLEESLAVARGASDQHSTCIGLNLLGAFDLKRGDYRSAQALLDEGVRVSRRIGERYGLSRALTWLGEVALGRARYNEAEAFLWEGLSLDRQVAPGVLPADLCLLGQARLAQHDLAGARALFDEALERATDEEGHRPSKALEGLGDVAAARGDLPLARSMFEAALEAARFAGDRDRGASSRYGLANVVRAQGDVSQALSLHHEALDGYAEAGNPPGVAQSLEAVGGITGRFGRDEQAARLLGAADALRESTGFASVRRRWPQHDDDVAEVRSRLGRRRFSELQAAGAALSIQDAIAYAQRGRGRRSRPSTGWGSLTSAERAVVALAAEGLTNPQIGERLFISPRTAARHLYHVFAKLEITSRTELAREASRREAESERWAG